MPEHPLTHNLAEAASVFASLAELQQPLQQAADLVIESLRGGGKVLVCGNGGSAADASHLVTELVVRFCRDRQPFAAVSLNDTGTTLTAMLNDYGPDPVFARQVLALGRPVDVLIVLSTSGNSANILEALDAGSQVGLRMVSFLGRDGGKARGRADVDLIVESDSTARIQEAHTLLYHTLCELIEQALCP